MGGWEHVPTRVEMHLHGFGQKVSERQHRAVHSRFLWGANGVTVFTLLHRSPCFTSEDV